MVRLDRSAKILDFGISRRVSVGGGEEGRGTIFRSVPMKLSDISPPGENETAALQSVTAFQTDASALVGTIRYMSPEQAMGRDLTVASDLYSLGAMKSPMSFSSSTIAEKSKWLKAPQDENTGEDLPSARNL